MSAARLLRPERRCPICGNDLAASIAFFGEHAAMREHAYAHVREDSPQIAHAYREAVAAYNEEGKKWYARIARGLQEEQGAA